MKFLWLVKAAFSSGIEPEKLVTWIVKYAPVITELIHLIEVEQDEKKRAVALDGITRGLAMARETKDTTLLEEALRSHIAKDGVRVP